MGVEPHSNNMGQKMKCYWEHWGTFGELDGNTFGN
jgi:hypothetical protein